MPTCRGTTKRGKPCKAQEVDGTGYCHRHYDQRTTDAAAIDAGDATPGHERPPRAHVDLDAEATVAWHHLVADLGEELAAAAPPTGLEAAAYTLALLRDCQRRVTSEGTIVLDDRDRPVAHPAIATMKAAGVEYRQWLDTLRGTKRGPGKPQGANSAPDRRPQVAAQADTKPGEPPRIQLVK